MKKEQYVGVVGSGTMGSGISQVLAHHQFNVVLFDINEKILTENIKRIYNHFERLLEKRKMTNEECEQSKARIHTTTTLSGMSDCQFVIEAAPEKIEIKKDIFKQLDEHCSEKTILATNTSSFSVTEISSVTRNPDRVAGMHFFNPVPLMPLVEIIKGEKTSNITVENLIKFSENIEKITVVCKDTPGFIVNRIARPFYNESLKIQNEQIASFEQIDRIMKKSGHFKMGPFELQDLIGIDVNFSTTQSIHEGFFGDSRFRPSYVQLRKLQAGTLGRKSRGGFYSYDD